MGLEGPLPADKYKNCSQLAASEGHCARGRLPRIRRQIFTWAADAAWAAASASGAAQVKLQGDGAPRAGVDGGVRSPGAGAFGQRATYQDTDRQGFGAPIHDD